MGNQLTTRVAISIDNSPHEQVVALVESVTFGSEGLRYQRLGVASQLGLFSHPVYVHARLDEQLVGVYVLDRRDLLLFNEASTGYYRGMLAVDTKYQQMGVGKALTSAAVRWMKEQDHTSGLLSYGCIDKGNTRSLQLLTSGGALELSSLSMYMMYKQWPKRLDNVQRIDDLGVAHDMISKEFQTNECQLRDVSPSTLPLFVFFHNNEPIICAHATLSHFRIVDMSAMAHWCTRFFVKPFSVARKRFDPDHFSYVSFSNVHIKSGAEKKWPQFVSSVLASFDCHFAATYVDPKTQLFQQMQSASWLNRWLHSSQGDIAIMAQSTAGHNHLQAIANDVSVVGVWPVDA